MENRVPAVRLGSELLMNMQVSAQRQKRKAPQLWGVHSARSGQCGDRHPPGQRPRDLDGSWGCFVAVSWCDCGLPGDILKNSIEPGALSKE